MEAFIQVDSIVEVMPTFQGGGIDVFGRWVMAQLTFPEQVMDDYLKGYLSDASLSGKVMVTFIVEADGTIKHVNILSSPNKYFSREVERVILKSPPWTPGYQDGAAVPVRFVCPIQFIISHDSLEALRRQRSDTPLGGNFGSNFGSY
jgi:protein TonB